MGGTILMKYIKNGVQSKKFQNRNKNRFYFYKKYTVSLSSEATNAKTPRPIGQLLLCTQNKSGGYFIRAELEIYRNTRVYPSGTWLCIDSTTKAGETVKLCLRRDKKYPADKFHHMMNYFSHMFGIDEEMQASVWKTPQGESAPISQWVDLKQQRDKIIVEIAIRKTITDGIENGHYVQLIRTKQEALITDRRKALELVEKKINALCDRPYNWTDYKAKLIKKGLLIK